MSICKPSLFFRQRIRDKIRIHKARFVKGVCLSCKSVPALPVHEGRAEANIPISHSEAGCLLSSGSFSAPDGLSAAASLLALFSSRSYYFAAAAQTKLPCPDLQER